MLHYATDNLRDTFAQDPVRLLQNMSRSFKVKGQARFQLTAYGFLRTVPHINCGSIYQTDMRATAYAGANAAGAVVY